METLHNGDCLDVMRGMADSSVDLVLTDPPYGLAFMGKRWDYDVPSVEVWAEALRVLKPGGHLLAFAGTRTQHRMACRIEDAGFEIRDMIAWVYGSGFPKSHNGAWGGTALKPALEPITMARKPLIGTVAENVAAHGTGGLNIDACRVGTDADWTHPGKGANTITGKWGSIPQKSQGGRWPANLIHDGSDEVLALMPETNSGNLKGNEYLNAPIRQFNAYDKNYPHESMQREGDSGSTARFFYCAKASKAERDAVNHHPTVKPIALMEYLTKLASAPGSTVLDPFMGSGTTGIACRRLGRNFIGIERDAEYFEIAKRRISAPAQQELAI